MFLCSVLCHFLWCHLYLSLLPDFYTDGRDIQLGNQLQIGNYFGNSASNHVNLSGIQHILSEFGRFQSSFGLRKPCTCTVQIAVEYSCFLVKSCHLTGIYQWSQVSMLQVLKKKLQKNEPNWDIWNQSWRYFWMEVYHMYRDCVFDVSFVHYFWGDSDVGFKPVLFL